MKQKDKFRYAEKCLYEYKQNLACLEVLKEDLRVEKANLDVHAQNYDNVPGFTGEPSNPVQARVLKIEHLENRIRQLERWTKPVTQMIANLNAPETLDGSKNEVLMKILVFMYFGQNIRNKVITELKLSARTFARRRQELIKMVMDYLFV